MMTSRSLRGGSGPLDVSLLGFGGAPLGNLFNAITEEQADATLNAAWDCGIRLFDTAPFYGLGLSEERFGRALAARPREEWVLSTKIGRVLQDCAPEDIAQTQFVDTPSRKFRFDYSYDGVMRSHEASLKRLNQDRIDVLLVHDIDVWTHGSPEAADTHVRQLFDDGGFRALDELRRSGAVGSIGGGLNEWEACEKLLRLGDFDCFLLAGRYTLLEQEALDSFLPLCQERGVGIIIGGPYNSGVLATGSIPGALFQYAPAPEPILEKVRRIEAVCRAHQVRLIEAALQFVLGHPTVVSVIPGANSPEQVRANGKLLDAQIPASLWTDLKSEGLLRQDAPVPTSPLL
jgi:D-threo-aldose 1-dehydrogenase